MIGQAEIFGTTRHRRNRAGSLILPYPRTSRVFYGITFSSVLQPLPISKVKGVDPSDFPHLKRGAEVLLDLPVKPSWSTVRRRKTTTGGFTFYETGYRPRKKEGFAFSTTREEIAKEKKANQLKRELLRHGINYHQLMILLHCAAHSQTLLERPPAKKLSPKTGGFVSHNEVRIMRNQRLKNQRLLASHGTIYHY